MKITIKLESEEVRGISNYLDITGSGVKITKKEIQEYIEGIVKATLYAPSESVSDYIYQAQ